MPAGSSSTVTAPADTVHEAFFSPVVLGAAVVADDYRGVLGPAAFSATSTRTDHQAHMLERQPGPCRVLVRSVSCRALRRLLPLDGTAGLPLGFDDATAVSIHDGGQALVQDAYDQRCIAIDELMLRIDASGGSLTDFTKDTTCDGAVVSLTVPPVIWSPRRPLTSQSSRLWRRLGRDAGPWACMYV